MSDQKLVNKECRNTEPLLAGYADNLLSARETWEVEKHLADCADCSILAQSARHTVEVLHSAASFDTSDDFMSKLHSRLDTLGPIPARRSFGEVISEWLGELRQHLNARPIPTLSFGMATFILAAILFGGPRGTNPVAAPPNEVVSQDALDRHVAVTASDPFDDPVAAKLEAASGSADSGARSSTD